MTTIQHREGVIVIEGAIPPTQAHRHHALQLCVARTGALLLDGEALASVLIDADTPHALSADDALTLLIDPETHCASALREGYLRGRARALDLPHARLVGRSADQLLAVLVPAPCMDRHLDPRVQLVLSWLDDAMGQGCWADVTLADALARTRLSQSRFLHLFKQHTGIPWRRMLVWRRAQVAMRLVLAGSSLTHAAHAAGYADSAHLSRQFKQLFGLSPSEVVRAVGEGQGGEIPELKTAT